MKNGPGDTNRVEAVPGRFDGEVVIVTGASRGIGRATAVRLAAEGATIVAAGRDRASLDEAVREIEAAGGRVICVPGNLASAADRAKLVTTALDEFGKVDVLVNNAAINKVEPSTDVTPETWQAIFETNVTATFFLTQVVARAMLERESGRIVNVASDAAARGFPEHAAYGASKAALIQLTRVLANEWGPRGIRVNVVSPGATWTGMTAPAMEVPEIRDSILARGVVGRICTPEEVAGAIAYVASREADMVTGHVLAIDGGSSAR
jgi:NAD(P)-dependent dehydrogenase (short-subunit alcohol dehydrogenase family)